MQNTMTPTEKYEAQMLDIIDKNTFIWERVQRLVYNEKSFLKFIHREKHSLLSIFSKRTLVNVRANTTHISLIFEILRTITIACLVFLVNINTTGKTIVELQQENFELFKRKNKDYGDSFEDFGLVGIIVRLNDKINRVLQLYESLNTTNGKVYRPAVEDERIEDTIQDLYNYCIIGLLYELE